MHGRGVEKVPPCAIFVGIDMRAPRIISTNGKSCGHKKAAREAAVQENIISTIDEFPWTAALL
jgi:hypothetical protein